MKTLHQAREHLLCGSLGSRDSSRVPDEALPDERRSDARRLGSSLWFHLLASLSSSSEESSWTLGARAPRFIARSGRPFVHNPQANMSAADGEFKPETTIRSAAMLALWVGRRVGPNVGDQRRKERPVAKHLIPGSVSPLVTSGQRDPTAGPKGITSTRRPLHG